MSLFGASTATATKPSSLFGSIGQSSQPQSSAGTLFGTSNQTTQPSTSGGLFGSTNNQSSGGSLFGNTQQPQQQTGNLFGSSAQPAAPGGGGLFGSTTTQQPAASTGLFGTSTAKPAGSLFGTSNAQQNTSTQQTQQSGGSLFGSTLVNPSQPSRSLFGSVNQPTTNFGASQIQPQQTLPTDGSLLNSQNYQNQQHILGQSQSAARTSLWAPGQSIANPNRTIPEQIAKVNTKWTARSAASDLTHYFYNQVGEEKALFYRPGPGEDEKAWDSALSRKPGPGYVPILAVGFQDLGSRIVTQQKQLSMYQVRLHEIDAKLTELLRRHDTDVGMRAAQARRRHETITQRCLVLATRVQVLRNRGYALEPKEEELKRSIVELWRRVGDPQLRGRSDEVWNRLLLVKEKMAVLSEDMGYKIEETRTAKLEEGTMRKIGKLLQDYAAQIQYLQKELDAAEKDLDVYQEAEQSAKTTETNGIRRGRR